MWKKNCTAGQATDDNMQPAHFMLDTKHIHTHSHYVIFTAFPLQQWFYEHPSILRYTYIACRVSLSIMK